MRLFVALAVPEPVRREVRRRQAAVRDRLPRARWVDLEVLHLTLLFLGEVAAEQVPALAERLQAAFALHPALTLRLAGGGTFPLGRPARVAWVGVAAPPELAVLQAAVSAAALATLGPSAGRQLQRGAVDERSFRPHVTLARCPSPWPRGAAEKFAAAFHGEIGPPFVATHGALVDSKLSPQGPRYRDLAELPLAVAPEPPAIEEPSGATLDRASERGRVGAIEGSGADPMDGNGSASRLSRHSSLVASSSPPPPYRIAAPPRGDRE